MRFGFSGPIGPEINFAPDETGGGSSTSSSSASNSTSSGTSSPSPSPTSSPSAAPSTTTQPSRPSSPSGPATPVAPAPASPGQAIPPVSEPGGAGSPTDFDFDAIFGDGFFNEPAEKVAPPPVVAPPAPAPEPPVALTSQPAQAAPQEPAKPAAAQPQPGEPQALKFDPSDPMSVANAMQENRDAYIQRLAQTQFALSPEDMAALEADVTTAVPRLLARVYVDAAIGQMAQIAKSVPLMVQKHLEVSAARTQSENEFYSKWPQLDRKQHHELVNKYAVDLRRMHPDMSTEEMMNRVGPLVMMQAGIPFATPGSANAPGTSQPPAGVPRPQVTVQQNGKAVQVPQPAPFVPAPPGVAGAVPIPDTNTDFGWMGGQDD